VFTQLEEANLFLIQNCQVGVGNWNRDGVVMHATERTGKGGPPNNSTRGCLAVLNAKQKLPGSPARCRHRSSTALTERCNPGSRPNWNGANKAARRTLQRGRRRRSSSRRRAAATARPRRGSTPRLRRCGGRSRGLRGASLPRRRGRPGCGSGRSRWLGDDRGPAGAALLVGRQRVKTTAGEAGASETCPFNACPALHRAMRAGRAWP
jgi:hypothetical protein